MNKSIAKHLTTKELVVLIIGGFIFFLLSFLLHRYISQTHPFCDIDSSAYLRNGFLWYKYNSCSPAHAQQPLPIYALGYPLFIGFFYKILGPCASTIIFVQILLALISGVVLFFLMHRLFGFIAATITYGLWITNLGVLVFAHFILAEMLLLFFLILFMNQFLLFLSNDNLWPLGLSGLALGISVLVKVAALYFPIILIFFLWFKKKNCCVRFMQSIVFLASFAIPLLAFMVHNKIVFDQFRLTYIDSFNAGVFFYSQVLAYDHATTWPEEMVQLEQKYKSIDKIKQQCVQDFLHRPQVFIWQWLRNIGKIFAGLYSTSLKTLVNNNLEGGTISYFKMQGSLWQKIVGYVTTGAPYLWVKITAWLEVAWSLIRYSLCCLGIFFLYKSRQYSLLLFLLSYIFYFSFVIACDGTARYRFFFEFVLIMLATLGIKLLINFDKNLLKIKTS